MKFMQILKSCGRKRCLCSNKSIELVLYLPINHEQNINILDTYRKLEKSHTSCYGSYQVMKNNLEWKWEKWDDMPWRKYDK